MARNEEEEEKRNIKMYEDNKELRDTVKEVTEDNNDNNTKGFKFGLNMLQIAGYPTSIAYVGLLIYFGLTGKIMAAIALGITLGGIVLFLALAFFTTRLFRNRVGVPGYSEK